MPSPPPFARRTARASCPLAWQLEHSAGPQVFRRYHAAQQVDTRGIQELLHMAQLPRAELLHMGCPPAWLESPPPVYANLEVAVPLLGRIALDAREAIWTEALRDEAHALGLAVIESWFA